MERQLERLEAIIIFASKGHIQEVMRIIAIVGVTLGLGGILAYLNGYPSFKRRQIFDKFIPHIELTSGNLVRIERFGNYVVRQLGLKGSEVFAAHLGELAEAYVRGDKSTTDDSAESIRNLLSCCQIDPMDITSLSNEMFSELDACIYSYFAFHWNHGFQLMKQFLPHSEVNKMRKAFFALTREQRLKKDTKLLRTKFTFKTLVDRIKAISGSASFNSNEKTVLVPVGSETRCPVLLLIGGGMGAGKSTAVKEILKCPFWAGAAENAVVVEADAFTETNQPAGYGLFDECHLPERDQMYHNLSTDAASSLLVTALNEGRDVIFDGTMSWEPFVLQTIKMARDVHRNQYRMGPGYKNMGNGKIEENYWEIVEKLSQDKRPYRIELVGVICDAHLAVVRGMRRAILTKREVPIKAQLQSHRWFAGSVEKYCKLVDEAKIFCTSKIRQRPELIARKEGNSKLLKDFEGFQLVEDLRSLNPFATSVAELYENRKNGELLNQTFREVVLDPCRESRQRNLLAALQTMPLKLDTFDRSDSIISASSDDSSINLE